MKTAVILTFLFASVLAVSARESLLDSLLQQLQAEEQEDYDKLEESALVQVPLGNVNDDYALIHV